MIEKLKANLEKVVPICDELWSEIQKKAKEFFLKKGEVLIKYGSFCKNVYVISSGSFESSLISKNGNRQTVWFFFDELFYVTLTMDSYYLNVPTQYEITALEDSKVLGFDKKFIDHLILKYPSFNQFYRHDIVTSYISTNEIHNIMITHTPLEILQYLKTNYPAILNRAPSKNLAHFMGITPEWYSKLKNKIA
ncbi:MAG: cyclic nucleotide-binding domain-containing protein [Bacteroidota bacterium]